MESGTIIPADYESAYNEAVERERREYHERRCAADDNYRRVFERMNTTAQQCTDAIRQAISAVQQTTPLTEMLKTAQHQPKTETPTEPTTLGDLMNKPVDFFGLLIFSMFTMPPEEMQRMTTDFKYMKEIMDAEKYFNRKRTPTNGHNC